MRIKQKRHNKYNATKVLACTICGLELAQRTSKRSFGCMCITNNHHVFDSKAEHKRFQELLLLEKAKQITGLRIQPAYDLIATGAPPDFMVRERTIGKYKADFEYFIPTTGQWVIEDVKGFMTALSKWKIKHMYAQYGKEVKIIK